MIPMGGYGVSYRAAVSAGHVAGILVIESMVDNIFSSIRDYTGPRRSALVNIS